MRSQLLDHKDWAHETYTSIIELLEWGRREWPNVPKEDRGVVFEKTFIRAIKKVRLENLHQVSGTHPIEAIFLTSFPTDLLFAW